MSDPYAEKVRTSMVNHGNCVVILGRRGPVYGFIKQLCNEKCCEMFYPVFRSPSNEITNKQISSNKATINGVESNISRVILPASRVTPIKHR